MKKNDLFAGVAGLILYSSFAAYCIGKANVSEMKSIVVFFVIVILPAFCGASIERGLAEDDEEK